MDGTGARMFWCWSSPLADAGGTFSFLPASLFSCCFGVGGQRELYTSGMVSDHGTVLCDGAELAVRVRNVMEVVRFRGRDMAGWDWDGR